MLASSHRPVSLLRLPCSSSQWLFGSVLNQLCPKVASLRAYPALIASWFWSRFLWLACGRPKNDFQKTASTSMFCQLKNLQWTPVWWVGHNVWHHAVLQLMNSAQYLILRLPFWSYLFLSELSFFLNMTYFKNINIYILNHLWKIYI